MDKALLVASSYGLGVLLYSAVHEFGHILAYWSIGFTQFSLYIDPFASSNVTPLETLPPERMVFLASSGMAFQFIICLFSWWILRTRNNALLVPLRFGAPMGILNIGSYLLANSIVDGDSWLLVQHGVPELVVNLGGLSINLFGAYLFIRSLTVLGFDTSDSSWEIFTPLFLGVSAFAVIMTLYAQYAGFDVTYGIINMVTGLVLSVTSTVLFKKLRLDTGIERSRRDALTVFAVWVSLTSLTLVVF